MKRNRLRPGASRLRNRGGFTVVEVIVAVLILVVGVLGLASTAAAVSRLIGGGAQQALAANVAQSRFEHLRATTCAAVAGGSTTSSRGVSETWSVSQVAPTIFEVRVAVTYTTTAGPRTPESYHSYITCRP